MNYELNKKLIILLLTLTCSITVSAQLTAIQVLQKMGKACDYKSGLKGNATLKMMGIGTTVTFETDGHNSRITEGDEISYCNKGNCYTYDKKTNTVTIDIDPMTDMFTLPLFLTSLVTDEDIADQTLNAKNSSMKHKNGVYEIKLLDNLIYTIDDKTFHLKTFVMKKGIMKVTYAYSNLAPFRDVKSLIYDKSKFPGAKVVDNRNGKVSEASLTEQMAKALADAKKKGKK